MPAASTYSSEPKPPLRHGFPSHESCPGPVALMERYRDLLKRFPFRSYVAFQDIAGTSSLDMTFKGGSYPCTYTSPKDAFPFHTSKDE